MDRIISEIAGWLGKEHKYGGVEPYAFGAIKKVSALELEELSNEAKNYLTKYGMNHGGNGVKKIVVTKSFVTDYLGE